MPSRLVTALTSRDAEVLLAAVRVAIGTESPGQLRARLGEGLAWADLVHTSLEHGVMPLLYRALAAVEGAAVPASVMTGLRKTFRHNARRNLILTGELLDLLTLFEAHAIPAMPLKGPVLAVALYGDQALRQFSDIDILVHEAHAARAQALLAGRGYRFHAAEGSSVVATRGEPGSRVTLDLQWALGEARYRFPMDGELWSRLEPLAVASRRVWQPAPSDQILILCGHPAKHSWSRLGWICDVAAFLQTHGDRVVWPQTLERASRLGGERLLLIGLGLAAHLLGTAVPDNVGPRMRADARAGTLAAEFAQRLFAPAGNPRRLNGSYGFVEAGLVYIQSRERLADKLAYARYLAETLFDWLSLRPNDRDRATARLPAGLGFLYYVIRPIRLARKYGGRLVRHGVHAASVWR